MTDFSIQINPFADRVATFFPRQIHLLSDSKLK